jgi:hypothetical protein
VGVEAEALLEEASREGLLPLLEHHGLLPDSPDWLSRAESQRRAAQASELLEGELMARALKALSEQRIRAAVFKGAALAYSAYPKPFLRPRLDTDLLVREADLGRVSETLEALGYSVPFASRPGETSRQRVFLKAAGPGARHVLDVHWKLSNRWAFGDLLGVEEVLERGSFVPVRSDWALVPSPAQQLLIGCLHPLAHHGERGRARLLWTHDLLLLLSLFEEADREEFRRLATGAGATRVCAEAIQEAERIPLWKPLHDGRALERLALDEACEPASVRVLRTASGSPLGRRWGEIRSDLLACRTRAERRRYAWALLFPGTPSLLESFHLPQGAGFRWLAPALWLLRPIKAAARLISR